MPDCMWELLLGIAGLGFALTVLTWGVGRLRRRYQQPSVPLGEFGWRLEQLEKLHESGELTDEQYKLLREKVAKGVVRAEGGNRR